MFQVLMVVFLDVLHNRSCHQKHFMDFYYRANRPFTPKMGCRSYYFQNGLLDYDHNIINYFWQRVFIDMILKRQCSLNSYFQLIIAFQTFLCSNLSFSFDIGDLLPQSWIKHWNWEGTWYFCYQTVENYHY